MSKSRRVARLVRIRKLEEDVASREVAVPRRDHSESERRVHDLEGSLTRLSGQRRNSRNADAADVVMHSDVIRRSLAAARSAERANFESANAAAEVHADAVRRRRALNNVRERLRHIEHLEADRRASRELGELATLHHISKNAQHQEYQ